jgi:membrane protease YdiL (CAAX protease family)
MANIRKVTFVFLVLLLTGRVLETIYLAWKKTDILDVPLGWAMAYIIGAYFLVSITLYLNRKDLRSLNIDRNFIVVFVLFGALYTLLLPSFILALILGASTLFNLLLLSKGEFQFEDYSPNYGKVLSLMLLFMMPDILIMILTGKYPNLQSGTTVLNAALTSNPLLSMIEEVVYRGMLWSFLRERNMTDGKIIRVQALLFWISHFNESYNPIAFWIVIPFGSILLGLIVAKSKSITFSSVVHVLNDFLFFLPR